jgi:RNA polymerase sigma factor (sigma-70 family)
MAPMEMTDQALLRAFAEERAEPAFAELVRRHSGLVYATACRVVGDRQLAEDAAQSTFLLLAQKAQSLWPRVLIGGWLYSTARRCALNLSRSRRRRAEGEGEAAEMLAKRDEATPPNPQAEWDDLRPHLDAALEELPEIQRNTIVVRCLLQRKPGDAARELKCSEKALSMRLHRALEGLRAGLKRRGVEVGSAPLLAMISSSALGEAPASVTGACTAASSMAKGKLMSNAGTLTACKATLAASGIVAAWVILSVFALPWSKDAIQKSLTEEFYRPPRRSAAKR